MMATTATTATTGETAMWCWCAPSPPATLRGIWGASDQALFAVGDGGRLLRFDGAQWFDYQFITNSNLSAVFGTGRHDVWAVGQNGTALHFDGVGWKTTWTRVPQPSTGVLFEGHTLTDVAVATPDEGATWVLSPEEGFRFDGTTWTTEPRLMGAVAIDARNGEMYAVGANAVVFHGTTAAGWVVDRPPAHAPAVPVHP